MILNLLEWVKGLQAFWVKNTLYKYQIGYISQYDTGLAMTELNNMIKLQLENGNLNLQVVV